MKTEISLAVLAALQPVAAGVVLPGRRAGFEYPALSLNERDAAAEAPRIQCSTRSANKSVKQIPTVLAETVTVHQPAAAAAVPTVTVTEVDSWLTATVLKNIPARTQTVLVRLSPSYPLLG